MTDQSFLANMKNEVDTRIRSAIQNPILDRVPELREMLAYQLGMDEQVGHDQAQGKRLRPLLLVLCTQAVGGNWENALSAAAAVELMHNFSLIHDDIQDKSELRRGRPTVWVRWGIAQAINAGDAMLGLAQLALLQDADAILNENALRLFQIFNRTLLELTRGQYLDLAFENEEDILVAEYDRMVAGKTGALLAACFEMGAILGGANADQIEKMAAAGRSAGRAFQIQDDWMGIWGSEYTTGKSSRTDLIEKKKTYPVIKGLETRGRFFSEWQKMATVGMDDANHLAELLMQDGIKEATENEFRSEYEKTRRILESLEYPIERMQPLVDMVASILGRVK